MNNYTRITPPEFKKTRRWPGDGIKSERSLQSSYEVAVESHDQSTKTKASAEAAGTAAQEMSGRKKLKKHRVEMGGRVWIPDTWGQEDLLKDWIDCNAFDASLVNNNILSARQALIQAQTSS